MQQKIYALLVGINHYASPTVPDLGGCVNDVTAIAERLQAYFGPLSANIVTLLDEQATYDAVNAQFRQHLIESARLLVTQGTGADPLQPPPAFLFHFSGHGSQAPDPTGQEPDGFDETLVCHDSRLPGIYDLKDWALGALLDELAQYTDNITVILDCCHAGSGTRAGSKLVTNTRACFPDDRPQIGARPSATPISLGTVPEIPRRVMRSGGTLGPRANHWVRGRANHVLIAACRDQEKALEYIPSDDSASGPSTAARRHGVLTHYLIPLLEKLDAEQLPTYRELYEALRQQVTQAYPQTPQCEGDWGRVLFGGFRPNRDLWLTVLAVEGERYWINGGLAHGLTEGTRLQVYSPAARTIDEAGALLGVLEVVTVGAVRSACSVVTASSPIPLHARLAFAASSNSSARKTIAVDINSGMIATAVRERLAEPDLAGLLALLPAGSEAALRIGLINDTIELQAGNGRRLGQAYPLRALNRMRRPLRASDLDPVALDLQRIVHAKRLDLLQNADSDLADALTMSIKQVIVDEQTGELRDGALIATTAPAGHATVSPAALPWDEPFLVEITNRGDEPLYVGLLLRSGAWRVEQLYPDVRGAEEQLFPNRTLTLGRHRDTERQFRLTGDGTTANEEATFLLIGTVDAADFELFLQQEESSAAAEEARHHGHRQRQGQRIMRSFKLGTTTTAADEWMSLQLTVRVVNPTTP